MEYIVFLDAPRTLRLVVEAESPQEALEEATVMMDAVAVIDFGTPEYALVDAGADEDHPRFTAWEQDSEGRWVDVQ